MNIFDSKMDDQQYMHYILALLAFLVACHV